MELGSAQRARGDCRVCSVIGHVTEAACVRVCISVPRCCELPSSSCKGMCESGSCFLEHPHCTQRPSLHHPRARESETRGRHNIWHSTAQSTTRAHAHAHLTLHTHAHLTLHTHACSLTAARGRCLRQSLAPALQLSVGIQSLPHTLTPPTDCSDMHEFI